MLLKNSSLLKNRDLNRWFWRWHIIAGLITLPFMIILSITGIIYLFKADYNNTIYQDILFVQPPSPQATTLDYQSQLLAASDYSERHIMQIYLPKSEKHATGFRLHGKGHSKDMIYVNPYTGKITGTIHQKQTLMYKVRKLHGELLLKRWGTLTIELVASWFIVLIITGLYIWWPLKTFSLSGLFSVRLKSGQRVFWRDMHAVLGFWLSLFMLVILAGGMPWTTLFGSQLKWVQEKTDTGYPSYWRSAEPFSSKPNEEKKISLNTAIAIAKAENLKGHLSVKLPTTHNELFKISNRSFWLSDQKVFYIDPYSGKKVHYQHWGDVGILMDLRQIAMRLHQGEYGLINWWAAIIITLIFTFSTSAGLASYLIRKPKGRWGLPKVPADFKVSGLLLLAIIGLGIIFPMFGISLIILCLYQYFKSIKQNGYYHFANHHKKN